jgi:hypothetical protein
VVAIAESEDPVTWPCWVSYILEVMQSEAGEEKHSDFLKCPRFAITARLDLGEW